MIRQLILFFLFIAGNNYRVAGQNDSSLFFLSVTNQYAKPVTISYNGYSQSIAPGKTIKRKEKLAIKDIPFTLSVDAGTNDRKRGVTEYRILHPGYIQRGIRVNKYGTQLFSSHPDEMSRFRFSRELNDDKLYTQVFSFVKRHPGSAASTDIIATHCCRTRFSPDSIEHLFRLLDTAMRHSAQGRMIEAYISGRKALQPGKIMQDFSLADSSGKIVSLYNVKSRYILVDFWFSTCKPCIASFPGMLDLYQRTKRDKLEIIGISVDAAGMLPNWKSVISKYKLTWIQLSDPGYSIPYYRYGIENYPTQVLLDHAYRIVQINPTEEEIAKWLSKNLQAD